MILKCSVDDIYIVNNISNNSKVELTDAIYVIYRVYRICCNTNVN